MDNKGKVLVIDDETGIRQGCCRVLQPQGFIVETASSFQDGLEKIRSGSYDLILLDLMLPDGQGVDLLDPIRERDPATVSIILTGYATVELAVETMKRGAFNFIPKPFTADTLLTITDQALEKRRLLLENRRLQDIERETVELTRARDEAERLNEFKSSFLLLVTHELRSPVNGAQSLVRTLLHGLAGELNQQQSELLTRVETRLDFLLILINDLLTLAASKSVAADKPLEAVPLQPLIQRVIESYTLEAKNKQVNLKSSVPGKAIVVQAIEKDLESVLRNLIDNAIKYTPQGGSIQVEVHKENNWVAIQVTDSGIGIPEEDLPHIGEEFFRAKNAHREGFVGTGLGMSIVKQLVARFGGEVQVTSKLGKGTTFTALLKMES
jgi:two-component system sensor histidine kinase/response regulator